MFGFDILKICINILRTFRLYIVKEKNQVSGGNVYEESEDDDKWRYGVSKKTKNGKYQDLEAKNFLSRLCNHGSGRKKRA